MLTTGTRIGPYEVVSSLGAGGMGEVYRARDTKLDRGVAIKILPESFAADGERVARFTREAQMLAALNHPHIAQIHGFEQSGGLHALVMELVDGEDLAQRIARGPIPLDEALAIAKQIAGALEAAHEKGIVHRDLKPANIKLTPQGAVKVLDFGLAKAMDRVAQGLSPADGRPSSLSMSPTLTAATQLGVILGTAAYMAPEQARGKAVDKRADIWAFGCVLYEMLTGRRAFAGEEVSDVLATVLKSEPDWSLLSADIPPQVRLLLRRCLEKDPRARVPDIALARFLIDEPLFAPAAAPATAPRRRRGIRAAMVASALVLAIAGTVALTVALTPPAPPPQPMRFGVGPSPEAPIVTSADGRDLAVSPDGRRIVYRAAVGGTTKLVVRDVNELDARPLDGTDHALWPFMSSDGQWIGFWSDGALKKVSITGGPPITICTTPGGLRGGSWRGDTIVFATNDPATGLLTVPAAGGEPTVLTKPDRAAGEGDHVFPAVSPDARRVLFTVAGGSLAAYQIAELDLVTKERRLVVRGGTQAEYIGDNAIVFATAGTLRAARFDPSRGRLLSEPVPVLERVAAFAFAGAVNYAVSRSGLLVYVAARNADTAGPRRSLVWVGRDGREEPLPGDARGFMNPRLSPDERQVAVVLDDQEIWTLDVSRGALTRQTFDPLEDETPAWLPDGKTIVYASNRSTTPRAIHRRRTDGVGGEEALWSGSPHVHVGGPTPDGRSLIVAAADVQGSQYDLFLLPLDGGRKLEPLIQTPFNEQGASVSPDGRWMAYSSDETGRDEIYVRAFPSLEGKMRVSTAGGAQPVWSKRGDELFFRAAGAMMAVPIGPGASLSVGQPQRLFDNLYYGWGRDTNYDVARNGRFLMVKNLSAQQTATFAQANLIVVLNWSEELKSKLK